MTLQIAANIFLAIVGVSAVWFSQSSNPRAARWSPVLGLLGQPAWFYTSYATENWGIFMLSFFYTAAWGKGLYKHWFEKSINSTS